MFDLQCRFLLFRSSCRLDIITMPRQRVVLFEGVDQYVKQFCRSAISWVDICKLTKLHILSLALHQSLTDLQHGLIPVPLLEDILSKFRRHDILYSPDIIPFSPRGELLADHTNIRPFLVSGLVGYSVCGLFERLKEVFWYQRWDNDKALGVVLIGSAGYV